MKCLYKKLFALFSIVVFSACTDLSDVGFIEMTYTGGSTPITKGETSPDTAISEARAAETTTSETTTSETTTTEATTSETTTTETTIAETSAAFGNYAVVGENGILVVERDSHFMGLMAFGGSYSFCDDYIVNLNAFAEALPDIKIYSMIIPTSTEFYLPEAWAGFSASQKDKIDYINERLINVIPIDAYSALERHKNEDIYSRTDHHWFPLGAYYAAEQFALAAGFDYSDITGYEKVSLGGYVGSLYNYSKDINLYGDPEVFTMYIPNRELNTTYYDTSFQNGYSGNLFVARNASAFYCSFLGSDQLIAKIETGNDTGRTLVVFKESYGNAVIPFITDGFDTIYVCDIRYFELNAVEFCKEAGATDLLFSTCTFTPAGVNGKYFGIIRNKE